jgi:hypothetical protein
MYRRTHSGQYHTPRSLLEPTISKWPDLAHIEPQSWDGVVEITVKDIKDFAEARNDPFYINKVIADEEKMVASREGVSWTIGWEEVYIKDGQIVRMPFGDTEIPDA